MFPEFPKNFFRRKYFSTKEVGLVCPFIGIAQYVSRCMKAKGSGSYLQKVNPREGETWIYSVRKHVDIMRGTPFDFPKNEICI